MMPLNPSQRSAAAAAVHALTSRRPDDAPIVVAIVHRPIYIHLVQDRKAALFRLYPTPEQYAQMAQIAGACRFIYNLALEQRRDWYRPGRKFNFASLAKRRNVTQKQGVIIKRIAAREGIL